MKIYFIYASIPQRIFDNRLKFLIPMKSTFVHKNGNMVGIYAWTNKKKLLKEFLEVRENSIYTVMKEEIDDDDFNNFRRENIEMMLERKEFFITGLNRTVGFSTGNGVKLKCIECIVTRFEYVNATEDGNACIHEYLIQNLCVDWTFFNEDIVYALDVLGYTTIFDNFLTSSDTRRDACNYSSSFELTPNGYPITLNIMCELFVLLYTFSYMFYGVESNVNRLSFVLYDKRKDIV